MSGSTSFGRVATVLRDPDGDVVSSIAMLDGPHPTPDKRQAEQAAVYHEPVGPDVRVGMIRGPEGSFAFPANHPSEEPAVRRAREEAADARAVKAA